MAPAFPTGVVVFFRVLAKDEQFARAVHLKGRYIEFDQNNDYIIRGPEDELLGVYPRDFVAAVLPLETQGPGTQIDASHPAQTPRH